MLFFLLRGVSIISTIDFESVGVLCEHSFMFVNLFFGRYYITYRLIVCLVFLSGWVSVYLFRKQLLLSLLSLEFMILALFLGFVCFLSILGKSVSVTIYLLVLGACEATLGLCLLVRFVRLVGSDMLRKVSLIKC